MSPASIIFNTSGSEVAIVKDSALTSSQPGIVIAGSDGSFVRLLKVAEDGTLVITGSVSTNQPTTQNVFGSVSTHTDGAQLVSGSVFVHMQGTQAVSGSVSVAGAVSVYTQGTQSVSGSVSVAGGVSVFTQGAQLVSGSVTISGDVANDASDSGNPVKMGARASTSLPTAVADGDRANLQSDRYGRQLVGHIDPGMQVWKCASYTTAQTGSALWTPTSGSRIALTHLVISTGGTTSGRVTLWFGAAGNVSYDEGTDQVVVDAEFAPSDASKPGMVLPLHTPIFADDVDSSLRVTTDADITARVMVYGYEFTP